MSSFKVWQIPQAIDDALENLIDPETGEMLSEEEVLAICEKLEGERDEKVEYFCKLIANYTAEVDALKNQKKKFDSRIKTRSNSIDYLKDYVRLLLNGEKWVAEDASVSVSYRNTKNVVEIVNLDAVPDEYFKTPHTESNLNKTAIKESLLNGSNVAGCTLVDKVSTIIK